MNNYYQPSGKFSISSFIYFIIACVLVFPILGALYAYAIWYIPLAYVSFIITGLFGFVIAWVINNLVIKQGKVRNVWLGLLFALVGSLVAYYTQWVVWIDLFMNAGEVYGNKKMSVAVSNINFNEVLGFLLHPEYVFYLIFEINEVGSWGISGSTVTGSLLTLVWVVEFLTIVGIGVYATMGKVKEPFCEMTNQWFKEEELPALSFIEDAKAFKQQLENKEDTLIETLQRTDSQSESHSVFTLYSSDNTHYLKVENKTMSVDKEGKASFDVDEFITYLKIEKPTVDKLKSKLV